MPKLTTLKRLRFTTRLMLCLGAIAAGAIAASQAIAGDVEPSATRFLSALDLAGKPHRITDDDDNEGVVLVFLGTECPISREYVPELNRIAESLAGKPIEFLGVISDPETTRSAAITFQEDFKIKFGVLFDASGEIAAALAPTHLPEAFLLDPQGKVLYRGRIDDQYAELGKKRPSANSHDLIDAITAMLAGKPIAEARTTPVGCPWPSGSPSEKSEQITYNRDIAPIMFAHCAECHRAGEVAPFSLLTYDDAAKRAEFISQVAHDRLMPPWKAEIGHGEFLGQRRLTDKQIEMLAAWSKAGAPEGNAADRPPQPQFASGWRLGEPGIVLKAPEPYTVPAGGADVFQHFVIPIDLPEDKTVVGFEFRPGNPAVVHHAILFLDNSGLARQKDAETPEPGYTTFGSIGIPVSGLIGVWTPGMTPRFFPQNVGMPIRRGTDLVLQLHMHPSGKEESDQSSVALYFSDRPVEHKMASSPFVVGTLLIDIPPGSTDHTVRASVLLPADVTLISLLPHMHLIGKEMKITATLPGGETKSLIWIKDWNFYWQDNYVYREPMRLPKGTRLDLYSRYDNSDGNPLNPSKPSRRVLFGNGSTDEMCFGIFQLVADRPEDERKLRSALIQSFIKQWNDTTIDPEARARIIDEAGKLFGRDPTAFLDPTSGQGGSGERRRQRRRGDESKADEKPGAEKRADDKPAAADESADL